MYVVLAERTESMTSSLAGAPTGFPDSVFVLLQVPQSGPKVAKRMQLAPMAKQFVWLCRSQIFSCHGEEVFGCFWMFFGAFVISFREKETSTDVNHVTSEHGNTGQDGPRVNLQRLLPDSR